MDPRTPSSGRARRTQAVARFAIVAMLLFGAALTVFLVQSRTGTIPYRGGVVRIPLRTGSFRVSSSEGRARYIEPGPADIKAMLEDRGPALGWRFWDQLGAIYSIVSNRGDDMRVVMITEPLRGHFVQVDCYVEPAFPAAAAAPPSTGAAEPPATGGEPSR